MGCWNVRTMWEHQHEQEVIWDIKERGMKLCVVTEGHWVGNGGRQVGDYFVLFSGHEQKHKAGVGFVLHKDLYRAWQDSGGCWQPISSRMATIRIPVRGKKFLTIVGVYAPTNVKGHEGDTEAFYDQLQTVWDAIPNGDMSMLMGDFNARIGGYEPEYDQYIGQHGLGDINFNGRRLRDFCVCNDLAVMGTFFKHKQIHSYTWMDNHRNKHMIDHVVVQCKSKGCIKDVRNVSHGYHTNADHRLVRVQMDLSLVTSKRRRRGSRFVTIDKGLFKWVPSTKDYLQQMEKLEFSRDSSRPFNDRFEEYRGGMIERFNKVFGSTRNGQKKKSFISEGTLNLVEIKKTQFLAWHQSKEYTDAWRGGLTVEAQIARKEVEWSREQEYRAASNRVKRAVEKDKVRWVEERIGELEKGGGMNDPNLFRKIDKLFCTKTSVSVPIKDDKGEIITDEKEKMDQWRKWGCGVFNVEPSVTGVVDDVPKPKEWEGMEPHIKVERNGVLSKVIIDPNAVPNELEVAQSINKLSNNKAADRDRTTAEMFKMAGKPKAITRCIEEMWEKKVAPDAWMVIDIVPIYKKGDVSICDNYRPISIIDMFSKAFGNLLKTRVEAVVEGKLLEAQAGFRKHRSCQDMIFILRMLRGYSKEVRQAIYGCFVDLRKAYDSVDRETLWKVLQHYGIDGDLLDMIKLLYRNTRAAIRVGEGRTEEFSLKAGVKQGCVLSPLLFNIYLDFVVRQAIKRFGEAGVGVARGGKEFWYNPMGGRAKGMDDMGVLNLAALLYADDTALLASSYKDICKMVNILEEVTKEWGLTISIPKTKIMVWEAPEGEVRPPLFIRGEVVEEVQEFKYLGSMFTSVGGDTRDVEVRINKAWGCFHKFKRKVWRQRAFGLATKMKIYKMTVIPTLLYGSESWTLTEAEEDKLESVQMRMLRSIMRISLKDHKTNSEIREQAGVASIGYLIRWGRLNWYANVMRMLEERWPSQVLCGYLVEGNGRQRGRPPLRWTDKVKRDMQLAGIDIERSSRLVLNRNNWMEALKPFKEDAPVALKMQSMELPCGGLCGFKAKNERGLKIHRSSCSVFNASMGRVLPTMACVCGRHCKGKGGLKTHQRSCSAFKKGKKAKRQMTEEGPNVRTNDDATAGEGEVNSNTTVSSRSWIALAWERCSWPRR